MARLKLFGEKGIFGKAGRRNLIIVLSVLIIGAAVYLNYLYFFNGANKADDGNKTPTSDVANGNQKGDTTVTDVRTAYFTSAALSRKQARDEALEVLQTVVKSEDALESTRTDALKEISRIALDIEKESNIETLVRAKGFEQCVAVLSDDSVSVIVKQEDELLPSQIAQIKEIVYESTGILPTAIKIIRK